MPFRLESLQEKLTTTSCPRALRSSPRISGLLWGLPKGLSEMLMKSIRPESATSRATRVAVAARWSVKRLRVVPISAAKRNRSVRSIRCPSPVGSGTSSRKVCSVFNGVANAMTQVDVRCGRTSIPLTASALYAGVPPGTGADVPSPCAALRASRWAASEPR